MKVFISWSGDRSRAVAEALQSWLRRVIQAVEPWLSSEMTKGVRWSAEVAARLEESRAGIFCLTSENLKEPWILFEAGAISKTRDASVYTLLLDIKPADVQPPLGQFQHTSGTTKSDMLRLVRSINAAVQAAGERALSEPDLEATFDAWWPKLEEAFAQVSAQPAPVAPAHRDQREILEELLQLVRGLDRSRAAYTREGWVPLREGQAYVMKNGALRPVERGWMMHDGAWREVSLGIPNLGFGVIREGGPQKGLLDIVDDSEGGAGGGDKDDHPPVASS